MCLAPLEEKILSIVRKVLFTENWFPEYYRAKAEQDFTFGQDSEMENSPVSEKRLSRVTIWHSLQSARSLAQFCF